MTDRTMAAAEAVDGRVVPVERRAMLRRMAQVAALGATGMLASCGDEESPLADEPAGTPTPTPTTPPAIVPVTDTDILSVLLQLSYLHAEFYSRAVLGAPLATTLTGGSGTAGEVVGPRQVTIADVVLSDVLREIAVDKIQMVVRLRALLGSSVTARPALNLGGDANGAFTLLARTQVGQATPEIPATGVYDVYASEDRLLLGAFILEDMLLVAIQGSVATLETLANVTAIGGMLGMVAHHAAFVRGQLYFRGLAAGSTLRATTIRLSDARDLFTPGDDDQGVSGGSAATPSATANIATTDGDGVTLGRRLLNVLNAAYLSPTPVDRGGFFPAGMNGRIQISGSA